MARHASYYQDGDYRFRILPLQDDLVAPVHPTLMALLAAAGLVLVICCSNVANLLLARLAVRRGEFSIRSALGASRLRVFRQVLAEGLLPAAVGGGLGLVLAGWAVAAFVQSAPSGLPRLEDIGIDIQTYAFSLAVSLLSGALIGLVSAWALMRRSRPLKLSSGRTDQSSPLKGGVRNGLMASQVALTFVLLLAAGLLLRSFVNLPSWTRPWAVLFVCGSDRLGGAGIDDAAAPRVGSVGRVTWTGPLQRSA